MSRGCVVDRQSVDIGVRLRPPLPSPRLPSWRGSSGSALPMSRMDAKSPPGDDVTVAIDQGFAACLMTEKTETADRGDTGRKEGGAGGDC